MIVDIVIFLVILILKFYVLHRNSWLEGAHDGY